MSKLIGMLGLEPCEKEKIIQLSIIFPVFRVE